MLERIFQDVTHIPWHQISAQIQIDLATAQNGNTFVIHIKYYEEIISNVAVGQQDIVNYTYVHISTKGSTNSHQGSNISIYLITI